ncbi:hypothetical protein SLEP1_g59362 [Rubroshorea leprosula]|uniref:TF-B3 domain-containing protein n=1 Tax=Rubroshorea leprosula TaxID=152421 RepID=A0AAV5MUY0_9ROSI|nr:hypothetical protein SLEP1_g59362 [Rubroshorea leprosula]
MRLLFSKLLSQPDIEVRFSVPMESLDAFEFPQGEFKVNFEAIDIKEKPWNFRLTKRQKDVHPKPVLSADWLAYVQEKHLQKNDKLLLGVEGKEAKKRRFRIHALRKAFRLYGEDIWVDVEKLEEDIVKGVPSTKFLQLD